MLLLDSDICKRVCVGETKVMQCLEVSPFRKVLYKNVVTWFIYISVKLILFLVLCNLAIVGCCAIDCSETWNKLFEFNRRLNCFWTLFKIVFKIIELISILNEFDEWNMDGGVSDSLLYDILKTTFIVCSLTIIR